MRRLALRRKPAEPDGYLPCSGGGPRHLPPLEQQPAAHAAPQLQTANETHEPSAAAFVAAPSAARASKAADYKVVFVGDASMSPYEIMQPGGSVEHWNEESGELWMRRLRETYEKCIWINPVPEDEWEYTQSIAITRQLMEGKMFPLTLRGLEEGMSFLSK